MTKKKDLGPAGPGRELGSSVGATGATGPAGPTQTDDSTDKLAEWSEHCLHYELDMLHRVRELRAKTKALLTTIGNEWEQTLENVFVESFEVHVRNLVEFFKSPPNRSKRMQLVHADNFLGSSEEETWRKKNVTADDEKQLVDLWAKVSGNALHPKRSRTHVRAKKEINFEHTVELFDRIATAFVSARGILQKLSRKRDWSRWIRRSTSGR